MQEFSQVFSGFIVAFFSVFLLHLFSDLLHCFSCMTVSHGSPIFGVRFCDTGVGVACDDMAIKFWPWLFLLFYWTEARVSTQFFCAFLFILFVLCFCVLVVSE